MNHLETSSLDQQVDEVIAAYLEAERTGATPDTDELLSRHPDLADELRAFFADRDCFARLAGPPARPANGRLTTPKQQAASLSTVEACRYVGLQPHARGGLGEVFIATDTELHRVVALKRLQDRRADDPSSQRRFLLEAEITARLEHPGVVPVHSLFRDDGGRHCYAMRFIEGQTLDDALCAYHAGPPDPVAFRRLLQSFIQVCETIAYTHSRGVIHRDLKPKNVMLGKFGETVVVDWGLAKVVGRTGEERFANPEATLRPVGESSGDETELGAAVGTPAYMSPEQAAGRWDVITPASDVYSLGAMLYAILTGRPPLEKGNWPQLQQKIQRGDFPRPRTVKPAVPRAMEAVCLKAMAPQPEDRYPSARALAAEVELWLADEPVQAYQEPAAERLGRWARRRRKLLVAYGVSGLVALVILAGSAWVISLQKATAETAKRTRALADMENTRNTKATRQVADRLRQLDDKARNIMDRVAVQVGQDPRLNQPEFQPLRRDLLRQALDFYDESGLHGTLSHRPGKLAYDLACVYARSAAAAGDAGLAERYASRALEFLREAAAAGHFEQAAAAERLRNHSELDSLRQREDFRKFLQERKEKMSADPQ